jgi:Family of unknown function (DUF5706)
VAEHSPPHDLVQVPDERGDEDPYAAIRGRHTVDYVLRNTHQQLVALSQQADLKANIMITLSSILLSLTLTHLDKGVFRWSVITFSGFLLVALVFALLSVLPKFLLPWSAHTATGRDLDLLFFSDIADLSKGEYVERMATKLEHDASVYRMLVHNIHGQSSYLVQEKYRYLTLSYAFFLVGVLAAAVMLLTHAVS